MKTRDEILTLLEKKFPNCWFKEGEKFASSFQGSIWSGSDSTIDGLKLVDDFAQGKKYIIGVHCKMDAFLKKHGWYHELYDCGTVFFYPSE